MFHHWVSYNLMCNVVQETLWERYWRPPSRTTAKAPQHSADRRQKRKRLCCVFQLFCARRVKEELHSVPGMWCGSPYCMFWASGSHHKKKKTRNNFLWHSQSLGIFSVSKAHAIRIAYQTSPTIQQHSVTNSSYSNWTTNRTESETLFLSDLESRQAVEDPT